MPWVRLLLVFVAVAGGAAPVVQVREPTAVVSGSSPRPEEQTSVEATLALPPADARPLEVAGLLPAPRLPGSPRPLFLLHRALLR